MHHAVSGPVSRLSIIGTLRIRVKDAVTGRQLRLVQKRNLITFDAGDIVRSLLAQRPADYPAAELQFGSMRFGTGSTAPLRTDTDLETEVIGVRKELTALQKVNGVSGEIVLDATLQAAEGNGFTYQEAGVFTLGSGLFSDNVVPFTSLMMFSRQIHAPLTKAAGIIFDYNWTFQFTT